MMTWHFMRHAGMGGAPSASADLGRQRSIGAKAAPAASGLRLGSVYVSVARDGVPRHALATGAIAWARFCPPRAPCVGSRDHAQVPVEDRSDRNLEGDRELLSRQACSCL